MPNIKYENSRGFQFHNVVHIKLERQICTQFSTIPFLMTFIDTAQNPSFYTLTRSLTPISVTMTFSNGSENIMKTEPQSSYFTTKSIMK